MEEMEKKAPETIICPVIPVYGDVECYQYACTAPVPCPRIWPCRRTLEEAQEDCREHFRTMRHEGIVLHFSPTHAKPRIE